MTVHPVNMMVMSTAGTGAGAMELDPVAGWRTAAEAVGGVGDKHPFRYTIRHKGALELEVGVGHIDSVTGHLMRDQVCDSTNNGAKVSFSAGVKEVTSSADAEYLLSLRNYTLDTLIYPTSEEISDIALKFNQLLDILGLKNTTPPPLEIPTADRLFDYYVTGENTIANEESIVPDPQNITIEESANGLFKYLSFNGSNSLLNTKIDLAGGYPNSSISLMFFNRGGKADRYKMATLFGRSRSGTSGDIMVGVRSSNQFEIFNETGGDYVHTVPTLNEWNHLVFTYQQGSAIKAYLNNVLVASLSCGTWVTLTLILGDGLYNYDEAFYGYMAKIRGYSRVLTADERSVLFNEYILLTQ